MCFFAIFINIYTTYCTNTNQFWFIHIQIYKNFWIYLYDYIVQCTGRLNMQYILYVHWFKYFIPETIHFLTWHCYIYTYISFFTVFRLYQMLYSKMSSLSRSFVIYLQSDYSRGYIFVWLKTAWKGRQNEERQIVPLIFAFFWLLDFKMLLFRM